MPFRTEQVYTTTIDDTSSMVSYSSGGQWNDTVQPSNAQRYYNATTHFTRGSGDSVTLKSVLSCGPFGPYLTLFSFNGTSAQLFGCLNLDHGNYTARSVLVLLSAIRESCLIRSVWMVLTGHWHSTGAGIASPANNHVCPLPYGPQQSLTTAVFMVSGLTDGPHTITLRNTVAGPYGNFLDFDYAIVNSTIGPNSGGIAGNPTGTNSTTTPANGQTGSGSSTGPNSGQSGSGSNPSSGNGQGANAGSSADASGNGTTGSKSSTGAIVGGVVGGIVAVLVIAFAAFWFYRKRKRAAQGSDQYDRAPLDLNGDEVKPYVDPESPVSVVLYPHSASSGAPTGQTRSVGGLTYAPPVLNIPPPPPSNVTSYPLSAYSAGSDNGSPTTGRSGNGSHPYENPFGSMSAASFGGRGTPSAPASNQTASSAGDYFGRGDTPHPASAASSSRSPISTDGLRPQSQLELDIKRGDGSIQPFTARSVSQWSSTTSSSPDTAISASARSNRMQVHGREVDLGPLPEDELLEGAPMSPLPPNYEQATEPLRPKPAPDA